MTTKLITMTLLAVVSLILGFLPLKIGTYFFNDDKIWKRTFTSVLLCFGGGVLFATSFIHMLPEVSLQQLFGYGSSAGKPHNYQIDAFTNFGLFWSHEPGPEQFCWCLACGIMKVQLWYQNGQTFEKTESNHKLLYSLTYWELFWQLRVGS